MPESSKIENNARIKIRKLNVDIAAMIAAKKRLKIRPLSSRTIAPTEQAEKRKIVRKRPFVKPESKNAMQWHRQLKRLQKYSTAVEIPDNVKSKMGLKRRSYSDSDLEDQRRVEAIVDINSGLADEIYNYDTPLTLASDRFNGEIRNLIGDVVVGEFIGVDSMFFTISSKKIHSYKDIANLNPSRLLSQFKRLFKQLCADCCTGKLLMFLELTRRGNGVVVHVHGFASGDFQTTILAFKKEKGCKTRKKFRVNCEVIAADDPQELAGLADYPMKCETSLMGKHGKFPNLPKHEEFLLNFYERCSPSSIALCAGSDVLRKLFGRTSFMDFFVGIKNTVSLESNPQTLENDEIEPKKPRTPYMVPSVVAGCLNLETCRK